jgi:hypothetical protein
VEIIKHIFLQQMDVFQFQMLEILSGSNTVDYLVVAGGGGGGAACWLFRWRWSRWF